MYIRVTCIMTNDVFTLCVTLTIWHLTMHPPTPVMFGMISTD